MTGHGDQAAANGKLAADMGLSETEWQRLLDTIGRTPTYAELGVFSVMWSEHCSYKSSRLHLRRLPTTGPRVVQGPGENAGAVDIGDGFCAVFKMESHNHPSFIEPYQGAATGVGGILRDVFTMGARPIASLNSLRFGRPDHPRTAALLRGVVAGIGGYGNCIGVPTVGGEVQFDASYDGNILVNAFTVGIARQDGLFFGKAEGLGNAVIYLGARTGRDGIHGATMASAEFDDESQRKLPTVQVGDPFMEKLLLEACLEIFATDCLEGVQDMGAAGLTSSSVEMAARAGTGLELDLDAIPRRTKQLSAYEMLLSESQERMLMVAKSGREEEVFAICQKWGLDVAIVGRVTDTKRFVCKATPGYDPLDPTTGPRRPQVVVDLPIAALTDEAPIYDRPQRAAEWAPPSASVATLDEANVASEIVAMVGSPNLGSRQWIYRQYDHIVRDGTVFGPGESDAAVIRVFCETEGPPLEKYLALSVDCNGRHVQVDPFLGAAMAVAECARNIVCSGGEPLGLTDCLNFGSPERPETMWRFARAVDGIKAACERLDIPVVSGNVSLYNETDGNPILPTPTVAIVGQLASPTQRLPLGFCDDGDAIVHLGTPGTGNLTGSEWLHTRGRLIDRGPLPFDLDAEYRLHNAMRALITGEVLKSAHDVSDGGIAVCLAEACVSRGHGAAVQLPGAEGMPLAGLLFGEEPSRIVASLAANSVPTLQTICASHGVAATVIGTVGGSDLSIDKHPPVAVADLAVAHREALTVIVGHD